MRWGARIVAAFTDEGDIRSAVALGHYPDPRAVEYIVRTLIELTGPDRARVLPAGVAAQTTRDERHRAARDRQEPVTAPGGSALQALQVLLRACE